MGQRLAPSILRDNLALQHQEPRSYLGGIKKKKKDKSNVKKLYLKLLEKSGYGLPLDHTGNYYEFLVVIWYGGYVFKNKNHSYLLEKVSIHG